MDHPNDQPQTQSAIPASDLSAPIVASEAVMDTSSSNASATPAHSAPIVADSSATSSVPATSTEHYSDSVLAIDDETGEAMAEEDSSPFTSSESEDSDSDEEDGVRPIHLTGDRMLDAETLRELMEGTGSKRGDEDEDELFDDEDEEIGGAGGVLKTANEILLTELPPVPEFEVSPSDSILFAGTMEALVDGLIVAQAHVSEATKALDAGSAICRDNRKPIGRVEEVFGPVNQPMYLIRPVQSFLSLLTPPGQITPARIFYVPSQSSFIFPDRTPGSDASNLHDEEIAEDQQEFSDDEKEMEMKSKKKREKKDRSNGNGNGNGTANNSGKNGNMKKASDSGLKTIPPPVNVNVSVNPSVSVNANPFAGAFPAFQASAAPVAAAFSASTGTSSSAVAMDTQNSSAGAGGA